MLTEYINKIYIISLIHRRHRLSKFFTTFPTNFVNPNKILIYDAVIGTEQQLPEWWTGHNGAYGCYLSHIDIWKNIAQNNLTNVLILEDDATFCDNFNSKFNDFMNLLPIDWDQAYIGGQHLTQPLPLKEGVVIGSNINRTHAYIVHNSDSAVKMLQYLDDKNFWINNMSKKTMHIDHALGKLHAKNLINVYASDPFLVGQNSDQFSDTGGRAGSKPRWWNRQ